MNKSQLSIIRQRLRQLCVQRTQCEQIALGTSSLTRATLLERTFRPNQREPYYYLSCSAGGVSRHRYVPRREAELWRRRTDEWRRFSQAVARWVKLHREIEHLLRAIGRERCVPVPRLSDSAPGKSSSSR